MNNWLLQAWITASLTMQGADCIRVDGDRILAGQLVAGAAGLAAVPPDAFLGFSPKPGAVRWLAPAAIEAAGARFGVKLHVPAPLCIERQAAPIEGEAVRAAMESALARAGYSKFTLQIHQFPEHALPKGELVFALSGLTAVAGKSVESVWRGNLRLAGSQSIPVTARVTVSVEAEQLRATRLIRTGETISAEDLSVAKRFLMPGRKRTRIEISEAVGMQARRRIEAGQEILPGMLTSPPEIRKGDSVLATVAAGGASLGIRTRAETMARKGQKVVLTNLSSGKKFTARAAGRGQAVVDLESASHETHSIDGAYLPGGAVAGPVQAGRQETAGDVGVGQNHR